MSTAYAWAADEMASEIESLRRENELLQQRVRHFELLREINVPFTELDEGYYVVDDGDNWTHYSSDWAAHQAAEEMAEEAGEPQAVMKIERIYR